MKKNLEESGPNYRVPDVCHDCTLVVEVYTRLYRVDEDVLGLTFEEWDPSRRLRPKRSEVKKSVWSTRIVLIVPI